MTKYNVYRNALSNIYHRMNKAGLFPKDIVVIDDDFKCLCLALEKLEMQDEVLNIFKSIIKRKDAIVTCPCIKDGKMKTNILITLDTLNDKDILCNETIKEWINNDK